MKIIKIGADWCAACLIMKPRWQELEEENPWLQTVFYDFDEDQEKIQDLNVQAEVIPLFIFLDKAGNEFLRLSGEIEKAELAAVIAKNQDR